MFSMWKGFSLNSAIPSQEEGVYLCRISSCVFVLGRGGLWWLGAGGGSPSVMLTGVREHDLLGTSDLE